MAWGIRYTSKPVWRIPPAHRVHMRDTTHPIFSAAPVSRAVQQAIPPVLILPLCDLRVR